MGKKCEAMKRLMSQMGGIGDKIVAETPKSEEIRYDADVNQDGVVDEVDMEIVEKSIRKKKKKD